LLNYNLPNIHSKFGLEQSIIRIWRVYFILIKTLVLLVLYNKHL
jgi:phage shock protein PspC (stress-responsive transcriptional regulator)